MPTTTRGLVRGLINLQGIIKKEKLIGKDRARHADPEGYADRPVPEYGAHDLEPPMNPNVWNAPDSNPKGKGDEA